MKLKQKAGERLSTARLEAAKQRFLTGPAAATSTRSPTAERIDKSQDVANVPFTGHLKRLEAPSEKGQAGKKIAQRVYICAPGEGFKNGV